MENAKSILIIDDETNIRKYLGASLADDGFEVHTAQYGKEGLNILVQRHIDIVLLDLNLPDINGLDILKEIKRIDIQSIVIIITAYGDINSAVEAIKLGAYDYMTKPFDAEDVKIVLNNAFKVIGLVNRVELLERQVEKYQHGEIITRSKTMSELLNFVERIATTSSTVIIYGETGTGKELIATHIHRKSPRAKKPFVTIDCTSLPENLLESELFGYEKGAFTGADALKRGLFEVAEGGTVFLDEIGELPLMLQSKILRVLESRSFRRLGSENYLETDVRIIAATNRDLKKGVSEGRFRSDLYYRLNVVPVYLPPLRDRKEDIIFLIEHFVKILNKKVGRNVSSVSNESLQLLIDYDWPGNIRELKNVIEHMVIMSEQDVIGHRNLPISIKGNNGHPLGESNLPDDVGQDVLPDFREAKKRVIENFEKRYLSSLLKRNDGNVSQSAREIQMHRSSFQRLLRKYDLSGWS